MARSVRKVSRVNTKNQKKENRINKKWLTVIISCIVLVLIGLGVGLGVYYGTKDNEEVYVSEKVYFNETTKTSNGQNEVTFNKDNYQALKRYIDEGNIEHMFVFMYDGSAFYADKEDEDHYDEEYSKLITRIADLQYAVNEAKAKEVNIELYVVDVHVDKGINSGIFSDELFGALQTDDSEGYTPALVYLNDGKYKEELEYEDTKYNMEVSDWKDINTSTILYATNYIATLN